MFPLFSLGLSQPFNRQVISFTAAGGKNNFFGITTNKGGNLPSSFLYSLPSFITPGGRD